MKVKYSRTVHLPWSEGVSDDDLVAEVPFKEGEEVVITMKCDGENTTIYPNGECHARSLDSARHPSRSWVNALAARVGPDMPEGIRICGENLYAQHSIQYSQLPSYFLVFGMYEIRDGVDTCLSWDETVAYAEMLGLDMVPVLYRGPWSQDLHSRIWPQPPMLGADANEGYVVRRASAFAKADFGGNVRKWVRKGHVNTDQHWMYATVVPNKCG